MSTTTQDATPPRARPGHRPSPWTGPTTRVAHQGGVRHGTVAAIAASALVSYLVYDGPKWFGVYERADPPRTVPSTDGPAELWVAVHR